MRQGSSRVEQLPAFGTVIQQEGRRLWSVHFLLVLYEYDCMEWQRKTRGPRQVGANKTQWLNGGNVQPLRTMQDEPAQQ